jgi:hypothetical protein
MENLKIFQKLSFTTQLAVISFVLGTILFLLFFLDFKNENILFIGLFYVLAATVFNGVAFIALFLQFLTEKDNREDLSIRILILLANIPIATAYLYMRVTSH